MATGFVSNSGIEPIDALFSRGGMASLLTVLARARGDGVRGDPGHAGFLDRLLQPVVTKAKSAEA